MEPSRHPLRSLCQAKIESFLKIFLFALLFASPLFSSDARAQISVSEQPSATVSKDATTAAHSKSVVRGRVVYDDNGQPLSGVAVFIDRMDLTHQGAGTETNERGEFSFENLAAGRYVVRAVGSEIIDTDGILLNSAQSTAQMPIVEVDGTNGLSVQVRVRRGGSITGQVTRADGKPAVGAWIMLMIKRDGRVYPFKRRNVRTDEQGFYRFPGLPTGEYMVSADELGAQTQDDERPVDTSHGTLAATLYPSTTKLSDAATVHVEAGGETGGINITLMKRATYTIYGTVRTVRGRLPRGEVSLDIREKDEKGNLSTMDQTKSADAQGRWSFDGVPDGTYILSIMPRGERPSDYADSTEHAVLRDELVYPFIYKRQEVTVAGADLKDLVIEVSEGATLSGTIETENGEPLPADIDVSVEADFSASTAARVRPDGTFRLQGIPAGNIYPYVYTTSFGESSSEVRYGDYYVKSIYAGGIELQGASLKVEEGAELKGVRLVISREVATVTGYVRSAKDGTPQRGINVVLLPTDPARQRAVKGLPFGFTDARGAFCASGPPGEYFVVAFGDSDLPVTDEKMKALAVGAPRVRLRPNERRNVDLIRPVGK